MIGHQLENQIKVTLALGFLYIFFVSLGLLSDAFIVLGGAGLNEILESAAHILSNPFCGLIIGILLTVLVQSSSTSTSIFITMTGSGLLKDRFINAQTDFRESENLKVLMHWLSQKRPVMKCIE